MVTVRSVLFCATDNEDARPFRPGRPCARDSREQPRRAQNIYFVRGYGIVASGGDESDASEMKDRVWTRFFDGTADGFGIANVAVNPSNRPTSAARFVEDLAAAMPGV